MNTGQMLSLLQSDKFYLIKFKYKQRTGGAGFGRDTLIERVIMYKVPKFVELEIGDEVIVFSPFDRMTKITVTEIIDGGLEFDKAISSPKELDWIVQKVCSEWYFAQIEKEAEAERMLQKYTTKQARDKAMECIKEVLSGAALGKLNKALDI